MRYKKISNNAIQINSLILLAMNMIPKEEG
jgi:hypothetical protein